jgi:protease-4
MADSPQFPMSQELPRHLPPQTIVIQQKSSRGLILLLLILLILSAFLNLMLFVAVAQQSSDPWTPTETHVSGDPTSEDKIAVLELQGTIMPPFTERWIKTINAISEDESVKGVVLRIDSPGGLVADSHQIYHALEELREKAGVPIYVSMARIAASGGYYIAMGAGPKSRVFAEPTTWTGSIGVIMPRYNAAELAEKVGVEAEPLVTGKFKDTLSPLREMTEEERQVWEAILDDAFVQFKQVILKSRTKLDEDKLAELATGQVFTADQAHQNGLIDDIGFQEDVIEALVTALSLGDPHVVRYEHSLSLFDLLMGAAKGFTGPATGSADLSPWKPLLDPYVPRALYFCGTPGVGLCE